METRLNIKRKVFFVFILIYLLPLRAFDLPGLAQNSTKHNFRNSWKSVSLTVERAQADTPSAMQLLILYEYKMDDTETYIDEGRQVS